MYEEIGGGDYEAGGFVRSPRCNPDIVESRVLILILLIPAAMTLFDGMPGRCVCVCVHGHRHRKNRAHFMLKEQYFDTFVEEIKDRCMFF